MDFPKLLYFKFRDKRSRVSFRRASSIWHWVLWVCGERGGLELEFKLLKL